jgi:hypothetical protein
LKDKFRSGKQYEFPSIVSYGFSSGFFLKTEKKLEIVLLVIGVKFVSKIVFYRTTWVFHKNIILVSITAGTTDRGLNFKEFYILLIIVFICFTFRTTQLTGMFN